MCIALSGVVLERLFCVIELFVAHKSMVAFARNIVVSVVGLYYIVSSVSGAPTTSMRKPGLVTNFHGFPADHKLNADPDDMN